MESVAGSSHSSMAPKNVNAKSGKNNTKEEQVISVGGERKRLESITASREENEEELRERRNEEMLRRAEEHKREFEEELARGEINSANFLKAYQALLEVLF
jgi:ribosomal protein S4